MNSIDNLKITREELVEYFKKWCGPVFVTPTQKLLNRFPKLFGVFGVLKPYASQDTFYLRVDWSLCEKFAAALEQSPSLEHITYELADLNILTPGIEVPKVFQQHTMPMFKWHEDFKHGDIVCISKPKLLEHFKSVLRYNQYQPLLGIICEKHIDEKDDRVMVTFSGSYYHYVANVEKKVLTKLPPSFKTSDMNEAINKTNSGLQSTFAPKTKFKIGDIVKVASSVKDETYMGLVGVVVGINPAELTATGTYNTPYRVDFDILQNRILSLVEGESGFYCHEAVIGEYDLDSFNQYISDRNYLAVYRKRYQRDKVWILPDQCIGRVQISGGIKQSVEDGLSLQVQREHGKSTITKFVSCRDLDYCWDKDVIFEVMRNSVLTLGVKDDLRDPNHGCSHVYIYAFDDQDSFLRNIKYKFLLGDLVKRKSIIQKFAKAYTAGKFTHPWQVRRYLDKNTLGYLYHLFLADDWVKELPKFQYVQ